MRSSLTLVSAEFGVCCGDGGEELNFGFFRVSISESQRFLGASLFIIQRCGSVSESQRRRMVQNHHILNAH